MEALMTNNTNDESPFVTTVLHAGADPFQLLVEAVKDYGIFMLDPAGNVSSWNPGAEQSKGYKAEEIIGQHFACFYTPADVAAGTPQRGLQIALNEGRFEEEGLRLRKGGLPFWAIVTITAIHDAFGRHIGFANVTRDITERREAEQKLRAAHAELEQRVTERIAELTIAYHALEQVSVTKDRFLSSMSHELRTPLNAIIGFTGTLLMRLPGALTTDQERHLGIIQRSSQHLLALINDILDLAKIESGMIDLRLELIVFQEVITEVAVILRPLAEQKGLHLIADCPAEPLVVQTDRRILIQILINLMNNAIKFTQNGSVRLTLGQSLEQGRRLTKIEVIDTGIGIPAEDQARLFHLFAQVDNLHMRQQEGTGLGLHLSQKLAGLLGGQITLQSELGQGSTFTLTLPAL
jgi:PAS domain S-box-containing protein